MNMVELEGFKGLWPEGTTEAQARAYEALAKASERIGANNYAQAVSAYCKRVSIKCTPGTSARILRNVRPFVSDAHREIIDAMPAVLSGKITPEQAMGLLHVPEIERQRFEGIAPGTYEG